MKINASLPFDDISSADEFLNMQAVTRIGQALERAGFNGGNVTDHPCPSAKWLDHGGHDAQDPFVMLSLLAAVTSTLRLQTGIIVLPYRNPFIIARAVSSLDVFSNGRLTLGFGAGYLKAEYSAVGVDFDRRNDLMDEYLQAMKAAWSGDDFTFEGTGYMASGNRIRPSPLQQPHPPIYVGGNSPRAIRRAVEYADGWTPIFTPANLSTSARTGDIRTDEDLAKAIDYMRDHCEKVGREEMPDIFLGTLNFPGDGSTPQQLIDRLERYREMGISGAVVYVGGRTCDEWCDNAERFGADVIARLN